MSGSSASADCYNCGATCEDYHDWKPFMMYSRECVHCGHLIYSADGYATLAYLNELRANHNMVRELSEDDEGYLHPLTKEEYDAIERQSTYLGAIDITLLREE